MRRYLVSRTSYCFVVILLGCTFLLAGTQSADARAEPATLDIGPHIAGGSGYQLLPGSPESVRLDGGGRWIELRGPITIWVTSWKDRDNIQDYDQQRDIKIPAGETLKITPDPMYAYTIVSLVSVDGGPADAEEFGAAFVGLVLGADPQELASYVSANTTAEGRAQAVDAGKSAGAAFTEAFRGANSSDFPNVAGAANLIKALGQAAGAYDAEGRALFPTLHKRGIQKILVLMAVGAAQDASKAKAFDSLLGILVGMDMANYKPARGS